MNDKENNSSNKESKIIIALLALILILVTGFGWYLIINKDSKEENQTTIAQRNEQNTPTPTQITITPTPTPIPTLQEEMKSTQITETLINDFISQNESFSIEISDNIEYPSDFSYASGNKCKSIQPENKEACYQIKVGKDNQNYMEISYQYYYSGWGDSGRDLPPNTPVITAANNEKFFRHYDQEDQVFHYYRKNQDTSKAYQLPTPSKGYDGVMQNVEITLEDKNNEELIKEFDDIFLSLMN
jgi:hypothetical protein